MTGKYISTKNRSRVICVQIECTLFGFTSVAKGRIETQRCHFAPTHDSIPSTVAIQAIPDWAQLPTGYRLLELRRFYVTVLQMV